MTTPIDTVRIIELQRQYLELCEGMAKISRRVNTLEHQVSHEYDPETIHGAHIASLLKRVLSLEDDMVKGMVKLSKQELNRRLCRIEKVVEPVLCTRVSDLEHNLEVLRDRVLQPPEDKVTIFTDSVYCKELKKA